MPEETNDVTPQAADPIQNASPSYQTQPEVATAAPQPLFSPDKPTTLSAQPVRKKPIPKSILAIGSVVAVLLLVGGGAYAYFGVYTQTPDYLWNQAVKNTGNGLKSTVDQPMTMQKGVKVDGSFKLTAPVAADGTLTGESDEKNLKMTLNAGVSGIRANLDLVGITADGTTTPDLYVKVNGLKSVSSLLGDSSEISTLINQVEDKWFVIDHTLLDQATASASQSDKKMPTTEELQSEVQEISKKMAVLLNERLFTNDQSKAVLVVKEKLGKEDFKGRSSQHLKVQVRKDQLRELAIALKDIVKDSKVNGWVTTGTDKTFEQTIDFDSILKGIDKANYDNAVADVWLDTELKYIRNVRIDMSDETSTSTMDFMLDYTGGDQYPLSVTISGKDKSGDANTGAINLGVNVNIKTFVTKLSVDVDGVFDNEKLNATTALTLTPTSDKVTVDKPAGATNILELVGSLYGQTDLQSSLNKSNGIGDLGLTNLLDDFQADQSL